MVPTARTLALPALVIVVNTCIAFSGDMRSRAAAMEVGQWLQQRYGPSARIFGPDGMTQVAAHYAQANCRSFPAAATTAAIARQIDRWRPVAVLLDADGPTLPHNEAAQHIAALGFELTDAARSLQVDRWILVMTRAENTKRYKTTDQPARNTKAKDLELKTVNCKLPI